MQAFNNEVQLKDDLLAEVIKHRKADAIIKGTYGNMKSVESENTYGDEDEDVIFKACAVGCSLHSYALIKGIVLDTGDHALYEEFGVPRLLAK